jgi:hypothetical protein
MKEVQESRVSEQYDVKWPNFDIQNVVDIVRYEHSSIFAGVLIQHILKYILILFQRKEGQ